MLPLIPTTLVGSYPQPDWLIDRDRLLDSLPPRVRAQELWRVPEPYLAQAQDDATALAIRDLERVGLDILTDGEIRRESYSNRFATALAGLDIDNPAMVEGRTGKVNAVPRVVGPVRRTRPVEVDDLRFLRANTDRTIKITLPGPFTMSQQAENEAYDDPADLALDLAAAVNEEVRDLSRPAPTSCSSTSRGCRRARSRRAHTRWPRSTGPSRASRERRRCTPASGTPTSCATGPPATRSSPS